MHSNVSPLPTISRRGVDVGVRGRPKNLAIRVWIKLCELPPSMRMLTGWLVMVPVRRIVLWRGVPDIACKLNLAGGSGSVSIGGSVSRFSSVLVYSFVMLDSSSSEMRRENFPLQRCPGVNFSSQL